MSKIKPILLDYSRYIPEFNHDFFGDHESPLYEKITNKFFDSHYEKCKFCQTKLQTPVKEVPDVGTFGYDNTTIVYDCPKCGWWYLSREESLYLGEGVSQFQSERVLGILRQYSVDCKELPIETLRRELSKRPEIAYGVNPTVFERLVGDILKDHLDCQVVHVGKSNDGGIDLLLIDSENETTVVQVKRRTKPNSTEGVVPIRELIGAMAINNNKRAIFVTTAKKYSNFAHAAKMKVLKNNFVEAIELIDFPKFVDILNLNKAMEERPWKKLMRSLGN
ncbi:restriction endonuclease [Lewinella sp. LCG006]|uniref:restriction endonuclease n=1 Tax=Lewinella sp. LCG006 TaxID=3231911 RepID=UPI0034606D60